MTIEGLAAGGPAASVQEAFLQVRRSAVRHLHAGDDTGCVTSVAEET